MRMQKESLAIPDPKDQKKNSDLGVSNARICTRAVVIMSVAAQQCWGFRNRPTFSFGRGAG
jgi:hypothetical protein